MLRLLTCDFDYFFFRSIDFRNCTVIPILCERSSVYFITIFFFFFIVLLEKLRLPLHTVTTLNEMKSTQTEEGKR